MKTMTGSTSSGKQPPTLRPYRPDQGPPDMVRDLLQDIEVAMSLFSVDIELVNEIDGKEVYPPEQLYVTVQAT